MEVAPAEEENVGVAEGVEGTVFGAKPEGSNPKKPLLFKPLGNSFAAPGPYQALNTLSPQEVLTRCWRAGKS